MNKELKFDRTRFEAGDMPIRTREGHEVLWCADTGLDREYPIVAIIEGVVGPAGYTRDGKYWSSGTLDTLDLVHEPKMRTLKIAVCRRRDTATGGAYAVANDQYDDFDEFVARVREDGRLLHLLEVEVPE